MINTLTGGNHFLLKAELGQLVDAFVAEYGDMALERIDGEEAEFDRMRESLQSLPFLSAKKMVVLRAPSANKQFVEAAESLLSDISETSDIIIIEPKLDKRLSYYKFLKKGTEFREFNELDEHGVSKWLVEQAKTEGGSLSSADARYLIERVGTTQEMLWNELQKLLAYNLNITRQTIDLLTDLNPQSTIFQLIDAAFAGKRQQAIKLYDDQRRLRVEPQAILAMIIWQLNVLAIVKTAADRSTEDIAHDAKINPFVVRKSQAIARKLSLPELKKLVSDVLKLDISLKSQTIDADDAIQHLILGLGQ